MYYMDKTTKEYPLNRWQVMSRNMSISSDIEWDDATLEALNVYPVWAKAADTIPARGEKYVEGNPQEIDGKWYQSWVLTLLTTEELQQETDQQWATIRQQQQLILNQNVIVKSDGNVSLSPDYIGNEIDQQTYDSYIAEVKDVNAASDPFDISWPANPFNINSIGASNESSSILISTLPDGVVPGAPIFGPRPIT